MSTFCTGQSRTKSPKAGRNMQMESANKLSVSDGFVVAFNILLAQ